MSIREEQFFHFDPDEHEYTIDGVPITNELLERAAASASAPAGRKPRPWLTPGGKSLSGGSTHSPRIQVVLSEETAGKVREAAAAEHISVSKWLRRMVEKQVA